MSSTKDDDEMCPTEHHRLRKRRMRAIFFYLLFDWRTNGLESVHPKENMREKSWKSMNKNNMFYEDNLKSQ